MLTTFFPTIGKKLVVVFTSASVLAGCMELEAVATPVASVRKSDPCVSSTAPFRKLRSERNQRIAGFAALGALGAGAIAKTQGASGKQTLFASLLGGAGGAVAGYLIDKQKRVNSTTALRSSIRGDAQRTVQSSDRLIRSLQSLNACRIGEVRSVVSMQRSGKISQAQAKAALRAIQSSARADNRLINSVVGDITKDQRLYVSALGQTGDTRAKSAPATAANYKPRVKNPQATAGSKRISTQPISVAKSRPGSSVSNIGFAAKELDAGGDVHVAAVEDAISVGNELLI